MRKKDWKKCWPFSDLDDCHKKLDKHILLLPPAHDPSFDSHRGINHWQEINSDKPAECFNFDNTCHDLGNFSSALSKAPKQDETKGSTMIDNASNLSCQPASSYDEKEKKLEVADNSTTGRALLSLFVL